MDSPVESTGVFRMRKDLNSLISEGREHPSFRLNFDTSDKRQRPSKESITAILEKEKQEKLIAAERLAANSKIAELETKLSSERTSAKRARIEIEKDLDSIKSDRERESEKILEFRGIIRQLAESEQICKAELAEGRQEWEAARVTLEKKLSSAQRDKFSVEEELLKVKEESWQQLLELKEEARQWQSQVELLAIELEETKDLLTREKRRVEELTESQKDYDDLKVASDSAQEKIKELEEKLDRQAEDAAVTRAMRADIERVPELEKELTRLRTDNEYWSHEKHNAMLLQEQLNSAQRKLDSAKKRCQAYSQLQIEHEDLKGRLQRWEAMDASGSRRPQSPSELSRRVKELQAAEALALEQKGQLQANLTVCELRLKEALEGHKRTQGQLCAQQVTVDQQNDLIKRLRRKMMLITKERDSLKGILESYESEVTVALPPNSRVKDLEEVVEGYQHTTADLETQLENLAQLRQQDVDRCVQLEQQCQAGQSGSSASFKADQHRISQLQERLLEVEGELKKASEEKEVLEMKIEQRNLQGDYDPRHTKVLHLTQNPSALAQQQRAGEVERLREENDRLVTRVKLLEQAGGPMEDLTLQVNTQLESVPESKVIEDLKSQLAKEELRKQRLVEAFKKTSHEFRETCYLLLGYKIDIPCSGQYRLVNMYSQSPHDYLLFKQGSSGEIQMLETEFSRAQQDNLDTYLRDKDSIPSLLSAITLDLFAQRTMALD